MQDPLYPPQSPSTQFPARIAYTDPSALQYCVQWLHYAHQLYPRYSELICLCIGTDRSTGDALGPLVGSQLKKISPPSLHIFGTLDEPVHAVNLEETMIKIKENHSRPFIIAIDACLGQLRSVGGIQVGLGPLKPGAGVNKNLPEVGQVHVTGIVNVAGFMEYFVLQNTRLSIVMKMADIIANAIAFMIHDHDVPYQKQPPH
ncbi:spore protease YyaC [Mechercharimyces sp. CAU 1602]|uniref:spore protease YyaC n=1 Tax=Mechercharimyces sp. CAU 1602 TaxID=2973933 RepID=UPI0037C6F907